MTTVTSLCCAWHTQLKPGSELNQDWKQPRQVTGETCSTFAEALVVRQEFNPDTRYGEILLLIGTWGAGVEGKHVYLPSVCCQEQETRVTDVSVVHRPSRELPAVSLDRSASGCLQVGCLAQANQSQAEAQGPAPPAGL